MTVHLPESVQVPVEPDIQAIIEAKIASLKAEEDALWVEVKRLEEIAKPHVERYESARQVWNKVRTKRQAMELLRQ